MAGNEVVQWLKRTSSAILSISFRVSAAVVHRKESNGVMRGRRGQARSARRADPAGISSGPIDIGNAGSTGRNGRMDLKPTFSRARPRVRLGRPKLGKTRRKNKHLPLRMYLNHGSYWHVSRANKWTKLGRDYSEALRAYAKLQEPVGLGRIDVLIAKYENEILPKRAPETSASRKQEFKRIRQVFGAMPPADLKASHAWTYFEKRGGTSSARHELRALSAVMGWAVKWGAVDRNPIIGLQLPGARARDRYVTDAEFLAVRNIAPLMIACAMDIALITAMRQKDILGLERRQIVDGVLTVVASKTKKAQTFPVAGDLEAAIAAANKSEPRVRHLVIVNREGKRYTRDGFQANWQRLQIRAFETGLISKRFTFHDLRAKSLSDAKTLEEARQRAQHSDARITQAVYRRLPEASTVLDVAHLKGKK